jgi:hypothetical protein
MAFDLDAAANILKVRYLGPVREQLNNSTIFLKRLQRESGYVDVSGKTFSVPLHTSRNNSAGSGRPDTGSLPTAGQQGYYVAVIPNKYQYGRIQITGPAIRAARDNAGAFVTAIESEIRGLTRDTQKATNRQLLGNGQDALGYATEAISAATHTSTSTTIDDGQANAFVHLPAAGGPTLGYQFLDAGSSYAPLFALGATLTLGAKGSTGYTVVVAGTAATAAADGDPIILSGTAGYQLMGIDGIIDDGDPVLPAGGGALTGLHGFDVSTYPWWKAQVFDNTGTKRDLTLALMQEPLSAIACNSDFSEKDVDFMLCNYPIRDKYVSLLVADKRFINTMTLDGGFKAVDFNGTPLVPDPQCKRNTIYYPVMETLKLYRTSDFDWMDREGGSTLHRVTNYDAYEATLFSYQDLGCTARNANAKLADVTD